MALDRGIEIKFYVLSIMIEFLRHKIITKLAPRLIELGLCLVSGHLLIVE